MSNSRVQYIDNLRLLACFLVVLTHSAMPTVESNGFYAVLISILSAPSSELFLTISGSLLLPTRISMKEFYVKRFTRLAFPVLFWSLVIVLISYFTGQIDLERLLIKIMYIPLTPVTGVYWFIYTICGLYLLAPVISPWVISSTKREFKFILLLWFITLLLPFVNFLVPEYFKYDVEGNYYFILNYLGGFLGYMLLGVYLRKYPLIFNRKKALFLVALLSAAAILPILYCYLYNREMLNDINNNLSSFSCLAVISIFIFFQNFEVDNLHLKKIVHSLSHYSFGIYLIHIIVVRDIIWRIYEPFRGTPLNPMIETPLIALVSIVVCYFIVKLISKLPYSKHIIGV